MVLGALVVAAATYALDYFAWLVRFCVVSRPRRGGGAQQDAILWLGFVASRPCFGRESDVFWHGLFWASGPHAEHPPLHFLRFGAAPRAPEGGGG